MSHHMSFDPKILDNLLRCTRSASRLVLHESKLVCVDPQCRLEFSIRDNIPVMLVEDAHALSPHDWGQVMQRHGRDPLNGTLPEAAP